MPAERDFHLTLSLSSQGWSPPDRAPALRRTADLLELRAKHSRFPDRVKRLAREMRLRAAQVELGALAGDEFTEMVEALAGVAHR